jgi:hypothetical protein
VQLSTRNRSSIKRGQIGRALNPKYPGYGPQAIPRARELGCSSAFAFTFTPKRSNASVIGVKIDPEMISFKE